jgi:two-component system cell cycle sensor histidine kinase/response regulator CckA
LETGRERVAPALIQSIRPRELPLREPVGRLVTGLRFAAGHDGDIDLLLTDVVMPELNGPQLAARLTGVRAGIKVLFISGYTDLALLHHGLIAEHVDLLQKPFLPEHLVKKVDEMLQS